MAGRRSLIDGIPQGGPPEVATDPTPPRDGAVPFTFPEELVVFSSLGRNDFRGVSGYEIDQQGNLRVWGKNFPHEEPYSATFAAGKWDLLRWPR